MTWQAAGNAWHPQIDNSGLIVRMYAICQFDTRHSSPTSTGNVQDSSKVSRSLIEGLMSRLRRLPTVLKIHGGGQKLKKRIARQGNTLFQKVCPHVSSLISTRTRVRLIVRAV